MINLYYTTNETVTTDQSTTITIEEPLPANLKLVNEVAGITPMSDQLPAGLKLVTVDDNLPADLKIVKTTTATETVTNTVCVNHPVPFLRGVNLAGGEFNSNLIPGTFNTNYTYPSNAIVDKFAAWGVNVIRMPFLWERLQPQYEQPFNATELSRIDDRVRYITGKGIRVILDPHNYGYRFGKMIGSGDCPQARFVDLWKRIALKYKDNPLVIFGLMNEPRDLSPNGCANVMQQAVLAIRNTGAKNVILVPGTWLTGAHSWVQWTGNSEALRMFYDPCNNFAFEVHQYFDGDSSGTSDTVVSATVGVERLTGVMNWARSLGFKLFLGEFGVAKDATSIQCLENALALIENNKDVWAGWTWWGCGDWMGSYRFYLDPANEGTYPQVSVLKNYLSS